MSLAEYNIKQELLTKHETVVSEIDDTLFPKEPGETILSKIFDHGHY
jgi:hypothetical protein